MLNGIFSAAGRTMLIPHLLVAVPFFLAGPAYAFWVPAVVVAVLLLGWTGVRWLRDPVPGSSGYRVRGPVLGVLIAATVLLELGALLAVRLVVVPDPRASARGAVATRGLAAAWPALGQPFLGLAIVAVLLLAGPVRRVLSRWAVWTRHGDLAGAHAGRHWTAAVLVATAIPFLLPLVSGGGVALTAGPVATPEYGKLILCAALAYVVARDCYRFQGVRLFAAVAEIRQAAPRFWHRPTIVALYRTSRFVVLPLALFGVVAMASGLRHDFGTVVPAAMGTMGVTWCATRLNVDRDQVGGERARRLVRLVAAYRVFIGAAVVLVAAAVALLTTDYIGERGRIWNDPWRFRWDAPCAVVAPPTDVTAPAGRVPCLRSLAADAESEDSQLARAIAATADGGLWGRGVRDRVSMAVPAGSTDFILAVLWNKLGGLVVIASGLVITVLSAGLVRVASIGSADGRASPLLLFAAGLGAMIEGQFLFVLAATANVVPHTGIPAPLLSRGGQSTLALGIGIALVLATARAGDEPAPRPASVPVASLTPRPRLRMAAATTLLMIAIVTALTVTPYAAPRLADLELPVAYGEGRPLCSSRTPDLAGLEQPPPDPRICSTDLIALARTRAAVTFPGGGRLVLDRDAGDWRPEHKDHLAGLDADDLGDLLVPGGPLRASYPEVMEVSAGTVLSNRLLPSPRDRVDGGLTLTLDPRRQHAIATTVRGLGQVTAAVVMLDAATGRVLVSAATTAPAGRTTAVDAGAERAFLRAHAGYVRPDQAGRVIDTAPDSACRVRSRDGSGQDDCWRWSYAEPARSSSPDGALGRRYPYGTALDPLLAASADPAALPGMERRLGLRTGDGCTGPDQSATPPVAGSTSSCIPDPADPAGARGTPLTLAVLASAVANGGRAVHPQIVSGLQYPATGVTVRSPWLPPSPVFPPATAQRLEGSRYPAAGGLHLLSAEATEPGRAGSDRWVCGFNGAGTIAFALVVEAPDRTVADAGADRLVATIRTSIGDRG